MLIIAHRGARSTHPENTLAAFQAALDCGSKAIELDIQEHDGELWVIHDRWLERTTNGKGLLKAQSRSALIELDAGCGEKIPTLRQVLDLISGQCALNIEIKGIDNIELLMEHLSYAEQQCNFTNEQIIVSSFNHLWLKQAKALKPELLLGALTSSVELDLAAFAEKLNAASINLYLDMVTEEYVQDAKTRGLKVYVYTVNEPLDWEWMESIGVDGIFCDYPKQAIETYPQPDNFVW